MLLQIGEVLVQRHRPRPVVRPVRLRKSRRRTDVVGTRHPRLVVTFVVHGRQHLEPEPACRERYRWVDEALEHIPIVPEHRGHIPSRPVHASAASRNWVTRAVHSAGCLLNACVWLTSSTFHTSTVCGEASTSFSAKSASIPFAPLPAAITRT